MSVEHQASQGVTSQPASPPVAPPTDRQAGSQPIWQCYTPGSVRAFGDMRFIAGLLMGMGVVGTAAVVAKFFGYAPYLPPWLGLAGPVLYFVGWWLNSRARRELQSPQG